MLSVGALTVPHVLTPPGDPTYSSTMLHSSMMGFALHCESASACLSVPGYHLSSFSVSVYQLLTRGQNVQLRREREIWNSFLLFQEKKEKPEIPITSFESKKRNLNECSQLLRWEREMDFLLSSFKKRKRKWKQFLCFSIREREIFNAVLQFWEAKEKSRVHNFWEETEKFSQTCSVLRSDLDSEK